MFRWCSHTLGKPGPPSPLRPADCACWLPNFCRPCRPLCCMPVSSEFSKSFLPSGSGPAGCQSRSARARTRLCLPTGSLPLEEPPARGWMQSRWEPRGGGYSRTRAPDLAPRPPSMPPLWPGALSYDPFPCPTCVTAKLHRGALAAMLLPWPVTTPR